MGTREAEQISGMRLDQLLADPQSLNSYSYVKNNPLRYTDPDGQFIGQFGKDMAAGQRAVGNFFNDSADYAQAQGGIIGHSAAFVNHTIGGMINNAADVFDPDVKGGTRASAVVLMALDVGTGGKGKSVVKLGVSVPRPQVVDQVLQKNFINKLFQENDTFIGGTAEAIRHTVRTGEYIGFSNHIEKGITRVKGLQNWLTKNPNAGKSDIMTVNRVINDLKDALSKVK